MEEMIRTRVREEGNKYSTAPLNQMLLNKNVLPGSADTKGFSEESPRARDMAMTPFTRFDVT